MCSAGFLWRLSRWKFCRRTVRVEDRLGWCGSQRDSWFMVAMEIGVGSTLHQGDVTDLLYHVKQIFNIPLNRVYAWTDSTIIVLSWLVGDPWHFQTFVNNRVAHIVELIGPECWNDVSGEENPANCASRGLFPAELLQDSLWRNGPRWLKLESSSWPSQTAVSQAE